MPARLRDIVRVLKASGVDVEKPNSGSHWKAVLDGKTYPIPAHNGDKTEIDNKYIRGVCDCFDLNVDDFKKKL